MGGEVVREVSAQLPGDLVQRVLTSKDPSKPVHATFTLDLSDFGAHVAITAPPTS